jgi:hypothetical protein
MARQVVGRCHPSSLSRKGLALARCPRAPRPPETWMRLMTATSTTSSNQNTHPFRQWHHSGPRKESRANHRRNSHPQPSTAHSSNPTFSFPSHHFTNPHHQQSGNHASQLPLRSLVPNPLPPLHLHRPHHLLPPFPSPILHRLTLFPRKSHHLPSHPRLIHPITHRFQPRAYPTNPLTHVHPLPPRRRRLFGL